MFIFYLCRLFRDEVAPFAGFFALLAITGATSVPALTLLGMEHLLHTLLSLIFICLSAKVIAQPHDHDTLSGFRYLLLLAALLPMSRYEGCFAVGTVCLFLVSRRRYRHALGLATAGAIPILLYGAVSLRNNWLLLPNSVLLKGTTPALTSFRAILSAVGGRSLAALASHPIFILFSVFALVTCLCEGTRTHLDNRQARWRVVLFLCVLFLHLQFAAVGWLFRYEAYLVAMGLAVTLPTLAQLFPTVLQHFRPFTLRRLASPVIGLIVLGYPFADRAIRACVLTQKAMNDRYFEHIQPARFLVEYYPTSTVVVNDIGAVAYYTACHLLDMYGLGNMEPVRYRMAKSGYTKEQVKDWTSTQDAEIAILQVQWDEVSSRIPDSWVKVAEWEIPRNVIFKDTRIGFFAVKPETADALASHVFAFRSKLPESINVTMMIDPRWTPKPGH
jgi:hypothetical protein